MREALRDPRPAIDLLQQIGDLHARQQLVRMILENRRFRRRHRAQGRDLDVPIYDLDILQGSCRGQLVHGR
jgi:hypothetical protein